MPGRRMPKRRYKKKEPVRKVVKDVIKSMAETKYYTVDGSGTINNGNAGADTFDPLFEPIQGDGDNQRIGNEVFVKTLYVKISLYASLTVRSLARVLVIRYKQKGDLSAFNATTLLESSLLGTASYPLSFYSLTPGARQRFEILHDRMYQLTSGSNTSKQIDLRIPINKKWIRDDTAAQETGGLGILMISDVPTTGSMPTFAFNALTSYYDL